MSDLHPALGELFAGKAMRPSTALIVLLLVALTLSPPSTAAGIPAPSRGEQSCLAAREPITDSVVLRLDGVLRETAELRDLVAVEPGKPLDAAAVARTLRNFQAWGQAAQVEAHRWCVGEHTAIVFEMRSK